MFTITEIPATERKSWSKCKWYVIEEGRDQHMEFVTRGQAQKYIDQRNKVAAQEAAKAAAKAAEMAKLIAHPVGAAVEPLRADTLERVGREFDAYIARVAAKIEQAGGDLDVLAPAPNYRTDSRREHSRKNAQRAAYYALCSTEQVGPYNERKTIVKLDDERVAHARDLELAASAGQYDLFIAKLVGKIGDCDSAEIAGSHVWGHSTLTVRKGDTIERWKTQQIINVSVLGKVFNQWPTRLVK